MALTRAQLLQGNSSQGDILSGQPQGVTAGTGVSIAPNGQLSFDPTNITSVIKTNNPGAFNSYIWPATSGTADQQLTIDGSGNLSWKDPVAITFSAKGQLLVGTGVDTSTLLNVGAQTGFLVVDSSTPSGLQWSNFSNTAAQLPYGALGTRPAGTPGQIRFSTTLNKLEFFDGLIWQAVSSADPAVSTFVLQSVPTLPAGATPSAQIPAGSTAQREATPAQGYTRFNTNTLYLEVWNGSTWSTASADLTVGLGLDVTGSIVKVSIPTVSTPPVVGPGATQAILGSLYWDDTLGQLFIYYSNGGSPTWVQASPSGGGGGGSVTGVTATAPIISTGGAAPDISLATTAVTPGSYTATNLTVDAYGRITSASNGSGGGGGTVTSVATSANLTGGPITTTGTLDLSTTGVAAASYTSANITVDAYGRITSATNGGAGTVTSVATSANLTGGPITTTGTLDLSVTGVTAASYTATNITVDAYGRITAASNGNVNDFAPGTQIVFAQAAAPTGWVQVTSAAYNDASIRLVTTAGGGTGGTLPFSTLFSASSAYTGSVTITSGQVGDTTITEAQLASHTHDLARLTAFQGSQQMSPNYLAAGNSTSQDAVVATGGSQSHTHSLIGVAAGGNFTSDFELQYVNMIVCSKS